MKREEFHLFGSLFGAKGGSEKPKTSATAEVIVTSFAQPYVLREKMK